MNSYSKILIVVDSFKGTLSSIEAAGIIEQGFKFVSPELSIQKIPLADGGEGTTESIVEALDGEYITVQVKDPLYRDIQAKYGIVENGKTAVIEMAAASGITLLSDPAILHFALSSLLIYRQDLFGLLLLLVSAPRLYLDDLQ